MHAGALQIAPALLTALAFASAVAAQVPERDGLDDFAEVCVAALLDPAHLEVARADAGLTRAAAMPLPGGIEGTSYSDEEGGRAVTITRQRFSDAERHECLTSLGHGIKFTELQAYRTRLEDNPLLGKLEGEIFPYAPGYFGGRLKRPGTEPLVSLMFFMSDSAGTLTLEAWRRAPAE